ncbi:MAG: DUF6352 family protein [Pseudomonadota bacterium]
MSREFWKSSGYHLVTRNARGWLDVTPDLLRAYYTRPEIHPVEESCAVEHEIFDALMADPFAPIADDRLAQIADADAADNYRIVLGFRDHLVEHGTVEAAYRGFFAGKPVSVPPVFLDQLANLVLRSVLRSVADPMRLRAAELFFRDQSVTTDNETLMLADAEIVETYSKTGGFGGLGALIQEAGTLVHDVSLDVLTDDNKDVYWDRSDRFDTAIDFRFTQPALDAFCRVLESWVGHFTGVSVRVQPMQSIRDERWSWHIGLDLESNRILNGLYKGETIDDMLMQRIIALFRMDIEDRREVIDTMRGKPIWMGLAMNGNRQVKMKPQNLLTNLPLSTLQ